jgi:hypothetical protein
MELINRRQVEPVEPATPVEKQTEE